MFESMEKHPGARFLLILACMVVVVAGLRAAAPILVPFSLALFLGIVSMPVMFWLRMRRVPAPLAIFLTVALLGLIFGLVVLLATSSVGELGSKLPRYQSALMGRFRDGLDWLQARNLAPPSYELDNLTALINENTGAIFGFLGGTLQTVASLFAMAFLVALVLIFILAEATVFPFKFQAILGRSRDGRRRMTKTVKEVQAYLGIKTLVSVATGITAGVFCHFMNLDFPILLGLTAFALNFIPTIGSIIAAIPAMALALILHDVSWMLLVALGYLAINTLFGNIVEPNLMGRRLGLSTLVVVLSLIFWGWVWGPIGALLSVPLTMVLKIVLENTPDLRWAAVLLDKTPPQARHPLRAAHATAGGRPPGSATKAGSGTDTGEPPDDEGGGPQADVAELGAGSSGPGATRAAG